jgi:DNA repair exonuclease SbcCD ATPase subunit
VTDSVQSEEADGPEESGSSASEDECPTCGAEIPDASELQEHLDGLDASRLECARQDMAAIKERAERVWPRRISGATVW